MKKLTALLLGTAMSIAFTTGAFADPLSLAKSYFNSDDGKTGSYLGFSGHEGSISDVDGRNYDADDTTTSSWKLANGSGATVQIGYDFGKIRLDWRVGALESRVESVDNATLEIGTSDDAVLGYSTINLDLDLYRFELLNLDPVNIAITPYVGAGAGWGGGFMTFKKNTDGARANTKRDAGGHGFAYTGEAGVLLDLTDWAGVTFGYNYLNLSLNGTNVTSDLWNVGVRFTY